MRAAAALLILAACGRAAPPEPIRGTMTEPAAPVPAEVEACLATIDRDPDPGHGDRTPSVACLIELGRPALAPTVELLAADSSSTRARATRVIQQISKRSFGFDGETWSDADRERWTAWWAAIGYDPSGPADARGPAIERLRAAIARL